jgi:hypothetical protein
MKMRVGFAVALVAGLSLSGCVRPDAPRPMPVEGDSITYETGPCFGRCPVYSITIRPDGHGTFLGKSNTAVRGERSFSAGPGGYAAFAEALRPYRPESGERRYSHGEKGCEQVATDLPSVSIRWTRAIGDSQSLYYYFGCNMTRNAAMADALGGAPDVLRIDHLIGEVP